MSKTDLSQLKLIVFDWDGTLMDSIERIVASMQAASRDVGIDVPADDEVKEIIGLGLREALSTLFPHCEQETHTLLTERYRQHFVYESTVATRLFEGVPEMLTRLNNSGYTLAIATGKARRGLDKVLDETNLHHFFEATRCADETRSKPHPQMLFEIMNTTGAEAHQTLMIGDTEFDLAMAQAAGVKGLGVSYGVHSKTRLLDQGAIGCIDEIREIDDWLL